MPHMKHWIDGGDGDEDWLTGGADLDALEVTEGIDFAPHPEHSWLDGGGHSLLDHFGAERGGHHVAAKASAETTLARTLAAAGHSDPDGDANAVMQATGGDRTAMAAVTRGVRVEHVKRGKRKGDVDVAGIVAKKAPKHGAKFKSLHASHKHARDAAEKKLGKHLEKKGHKGRKASGHAHLLRRAVGGDLAALSAIDAAIAASPSGAGLNLCNAVGQVSPWLGRHYQRLAMQSGLGCQPPAPPTGWFGGGTGPQGDTLGPGASLASGQVMFSNQNSTKLRMNSNGSVDLLDPTQHDKTMWHITGGRPGAVLVMQPGGLLAVRNTDGSISWTSSNPPDNVAAPVPGAYLLVQNDGNVVVYDPSGNPLWSPNTFKNFRRHPQPGPNAGAAAQTLPDGYVSAQAPMSDQNWNDTDNGASAPPPPDGSGDGSDGGGGDGSGGGGAAPSDGGDDGSSDASAAAPSDGSDSSSDSSSDASGAPPAGGGSDGSSNVSGDAFGCDFTMSWGLRG
jgi:hypothetical protein